MPSLPVDCNILDKSFILFRTAAIICSLPVACLLPFKSVSLFLKSSLQARSCKLRSTRFVRQKKKCTLKTLYRETGNSGMPPPSFRRWVYSRSPFRCSVTKAGKPCLSLSTCTLEQGQSIHTDTVDQKRLARCTGTCAGRNTQRRPWFTCALPFNLVYCSGKNTFLVAWQTLKQWLVMVVFSESKKQTRKTIIFTHRENSKTIFFLLAQSNTFCINGQR